MSAQLWVSVVQIGCFFGLVALGYYLVLEGADFFNFALGPFAMFSGLTASWLMAQQGWPLGFAAVLGIAIAAVLAVVTEVALVRPIDARTGGGELPSLIAVVAVLFAVEQLAGTLFGRQLMPGRSWLPDTTLDLGFVTVDGQTLVLVACTLVSFTGVWVWMRKSKYGRILRAVGSNREAARTLGMPVGRVRLVAFALAGLVVGLAGQLFSAKAGVSFQSGFGWALSGFLALVIGGTGSVWAPLAGGLLLALAQTLVPYYLGSASLDYAVLAVAILFFALRPSGLFVRRVRV
ncbi:branched-chain amino acid ABC transporter permease [Actinomadura formosensis]|uniref:branched-chain amino acid ABC transporter permease n=1 Tax=Actinomadura formosensis TaxID=60706 RepID=UPI00082C5AE3|nr:branched-chain amino acid ABC transporter permease [Actinomadura formosensis]